jgi:hypothetical protein
MRCEHTSKSGQCYHNAVEGSKFCADHSRDPQAGQKRQYMLNKAIYQQRYSAFAESDDLRTLKDEIAILRMVMQERLNMIGSDSEMLASCGQIASLAVTIERLVKSCHTLESRLGSLLAKPTLLGIANDMVQILLQELADQPNYEILVDKISERILKVITEAK